MKRLTIAALAAWGGILALAWHLADARIALCREVNPYSGESSGPNIMSCLVRATAARDATLIWGLTLGAVLAIGALWLLARSMSRQGTAGPAPIKRRGGHLLND